MNEFNIPDDVSSDLERHCEHFYKKPSKQSAEIVFNKVVGATYYCTCESDIKRLFDCYTFCMSYLANGGKIDLHKGVNENEKNMYGISNAVGNSNSVSRGRTT